VAKPKDGGARAAGIGRGGMPTRISRLPIEWMDPMCWRLPSGKDLAEFALQSGFLAPLMMGTPATVKRRKIIPAVSAPVADARVGEVPEHSGTFRGTR